MLAVLRQRDFALLWFAGLISMLGDWMLAIALPLAVYDLTGSPLATGGVLAANKLAALIIGSGAGVFVDRWDRKRTMVIANLIRGPVLLLLMLVGSADRVWIVYVVAAVMSAVGQFFRPAESALLPLLVRRELLVPANALNALNGNLSGLLGPALGGLAAAWIGLGGVAALDAASFFVAAGMIAAITATTVPERAQPTGGVKRNLETLRDDWLAGIRVIRVNPVLRVVVVVFAIASLGEGVLQTAFWVFVRRTLHGGTPEAGWLLSAQAIGGMIGAVAIGRWGNRRPPIALLGWGAFLVGLIDLAVFNYPRIVPGIGLGLMLLALDGLPASAFGTGYAASVQTETEDAFRGRVFGALSAISALCMIGGAAIAGLATPRLGAVAVLSLDSLGYAGGGAFALWALATGTATRFGRASPETSVSAPPG